MARFVTEISKYLLVLFFAIYTLECFTVFTTNSNYKKSRILSRQTFIMFCIQFIGNLVIFVNLAEINILFFYALQFILIIAIMALYKALYPRISKLVLNNMCMLLTIGLFVLARLNPTKAWKQLILIIFAFIVSLFVPVFIRKYKELERFKMLYAIIGIISLAFVLVLGVTSGGAKLGITIFGYSIQPSELVKISFVFFVAASFKKDSSFKNVVFTSIIAGFQIIILVLSRDLGAAVILFVTYLIMLYVSTRSIGYLGLGICGGSLASIVAYYLFSHVRVRVLAFKDPIVNYDNGGYQIAQSLFAIGTGSLFGVGLTRGLPNLIPVADEDFIFSAIAEEMGIIFAILLILVCASIYISFLNIAMQLKNNFYKLVALGLGTCYMIQTFLNIGGVTKFIPSTGVTLPLVSYGGSSLLSTLIMFAIIQALYIMREEEEIKEVRKNKKNS